MNLPATIPGLLRAPCRICRADGRRGTVIAIPKPEADEVGYSMAGCVVVVWDRPWSDCCDAVPTNVDVDALSLDLTDPTGLAHAAWWLLEHGPKAWTQPGYLALYDCSLNAAKPEQIEWIRRQVLILSINRRPHHPAVNDWRAALEAP